jgi:phage tail sheath protein FI
VNWIAASANSGFDGTDIDDNDVIGQQGPKTGLYALNRADLFNLLCIPPRIRGTQSLPSTYTATSAAVYQAALTLCVERRALLIVDPDPAWALSINQAIQHAIDGRNDLNLTGPDARNAALYFPCVRQVDPLQDSRIDTFVPCGIVAGVIARTDVSRGVWKAPAGLDASLNGVQDLQVNLNDLENGQLNPLGINCLRSFGVNGRLVWGARTLRGADESADEYKYLPVRRLALFLEESLYRGTQWVVFEPNDEPLWAQVRLNVGAFMQGLFRQGAFQGKTPAEFVVIHIQQIAGQIPT